MSTEIESRVIEETARIIYNARGREEGHPRRRLWSLLDSAHQGWDQSWGADSVVDHLARNGSLRWCRSHTYRKQSAILQEIRAAGLRAISADTAVIVWTGVLLDPYETMLREALADWTGDSEEDLEDDQRELRDNLELSREIALQWVRFQVVASFRESAPEIPESLQQAASAFLMEGKLTDAMVRSVRNATGLPYAPAFRTIRWVARLYAASALYHPRPYFSEDVTLPGRVPTMAEAREQQWVATGSSDRPFLPLSAAREAVDDRVRHRLGYKDFLEIALADRFALDLQAGKSRGEVRLSVPVTEFQAGAAAANLNLGQGKCALWMGAVQNMGEDWTAPVIWIEDDGLDVRLRVGTARSLLGRIELTPTEVAAAPPRMFETQDGLRWIHECTVALRSPVSTDLSDRPPPLGAEMS